MENSTTSVTNSKTGKTLNVANQYLKGYENSIEIEGQGLV